MRTPTYLIDKILLSVDSSGNASKSWNHSTKIFKSKGGGIVEINGITIIYPDHYIDSALVDPSLTEQAHQAKLLCPNNKDNRCQQKEMSKREELVKLTEEVKTRTNNLPREPS